MISGSAEKTSESENMKQEEVGKRLRGAVIYVCNMWMSVRMTAASDKQK